MIFFLNSTQFQPKLNFANLTGFKLKVATQKKIFFGAEPLEIRLKSTFKSMKISSVFTRAIAMHLKQASY
jgi:hypothetical protein